MPYPDWQQQAVTLALPNGTSFTFPNNGTGLTDSAQGNVSQRATGDGWVTQPWPAKPRTYSHQGITGPEGVDPWLRARADFVNQRAIYSNKLTRTTSTVVVTRFDVIGDGAHPARFAWSIEATEAPQYTPRS